MTVGVLCLNQGSFTFGVNIFPLHLFRASENNIVIKVNLLAHQTTINTGDKALIIGFKLSSIALGTTSNFLKTLHYQIMMKE